MLLAAPLLLFVIFRVLPIFTNSGWEPFWYTGVAGLVQYYSSTVAGFLALIIALLSQHGLGATVNTRSVFLTLGFFTLAFFLLTSSLGIPYLLLRQTVHPALIWSLFMSLPVSSLFFVLAGVRWTAVIDKRLTAYRWSFATAGLIIFLLYLVFIFTFATPLSQASQTTSYDRYLIALVGITFLLWAARQSYHYSLAENNPLEQKMALTFLLLAEAEICLAFGLLGTMSWLLHLPLLLAALSLTLHPLLGNAVRYQRERRYRAELTQLIVHDLKSPLTIVMSGLDLLQRGKLGHVNETQQRLLANLEHCSHDVLRMVNDMLDVERMEEGVMPLHLALHDLTPLLREQMADLQILADKHQQKLQFYTAETIPRVYVDPALISRVVQNLIANALKFTPDGGHIVARIETEKNSLVVSIADNGPGVPVKDRQYIFEKFAQLDTTKRRGKGLGLTFCKMAAEAHGGALTVEDSPLGGALFKLTLPINTLAQVSPSAEAESRPYRLIWGK